MGACLVIAREAYNEHRTYPSSDPRSPRAYSISMQGAGKHSCGPRTRNVRRRGRVWSYKQYRRTAVNNSAAVWFRKALPRFMAGSHEVERVKQCSRRIIRAHRCPALLTSQTRPLPLHKQSDSARALNNGGVASTISMVSVCQM